MSKSKLLNEYLSVLQEDHLNEFPGVMASIGAVASVTMILRFAIEQYRTMLTKAGRECSDLQGSSRNVCMISFKIRAVDKQIQTLQSGKSKCGFINRQKCQNRINDKIRDLNRKKQDLQKHYTMYKQKENQEQRAQQIRA